MKMRFAAIVAFSALLLGVALPCRAQWLTQSMKLTNGWNAVYLHVDASYTTLDKLIAWDTNNPIQEIWMWSPTAQTMEQIEDPLQPIPANTQWVTWFRSASLSSLLQRLVGNVACLVRVQITNGPAFTYNWQLKGKPVPPKYQWTTTGLNFLGFPTVPNPPPNFEAFLGQCPEMLQNAEIFQYTGGDLGSNNPSLVVNKRSATVDRGEAYWIRAGTYYNRYFAPFELSLPKSSGVEFDTTGSASFRVRNLTPAELSVTVQLLSSETPPTNQAAIAGVPPLLVRGSLSMTNLTYGYSNLTTLTPYKWTLAAKDHPGSDIDVVMGVDRAAVTQPAGSLLAGVLRFSDSLGQCQVDVPVSASVTSKAGLWVGAASVSMVGEYLKTYQLDENGNPMASTNGSYMVIDVSTNLASVPAPYPLRLIVHNPDSTGPAVLLQHVFYGVDANTNLILSTGESPLNRSFLPQARRISATHLPWTSTNTGWAFDARLGEKTNLVTTINVSFKDQASNPFLHTYHPDHDNLNSTFDSTLAQGQESYSVQRQVRLNLATPTNDFDSRTSAGQNVSGTYGETITVLGLARAGGTNDARQFQVSGTFSLNRILSNTNLVIAP